MSVSRTIQQQHMMMQIGERFATHDLSQYAYVECELLYTANTMQWVQEGGLRL